jgi:hypothetical protein
MEQGIKDTDVDYVHELKQGLAKNGIAFINGFISAIPMVIIVCLVILAAIFYFVF